MGDTPKKELLIERIVKVGKSIEDEKDQFSKFEKKSLMRVLLQQLKKEVGTVEFKRWVGEAKKTLHLTETPTSRKGR